MKIDLSGLSELKSKNISPDTSKTSIKPSLDKNEYKTINTQKNAPKVNIEDLEGINRLQIKADQNKTEKDYALEVYGEYQKNIRISSHLQTEIIKGVNNGDDIYELFLKACKIISLMTSDIVFYKQIIDDMRAIYGRGFNKKPILQEELEEVENRLQLLMDAKQRENDADSLSRIKKAIISHKKLITHLNNLIEK